MRKRTALITMPSDVATLSYIAGFFDGEGSVSISVIQARPQHGSRNASHRLIANISNNDEAVILWLHNLIGGSIFSQLSRLATKLNYRWVVQGRNAQTFLLAIQPYVRIKRERVALALEFLDLALNRDKRHPGTYGAAPIAPADMTAREDMRQRMLLLNDRHVHRMRA